MTRDFLGYNDNPQDIRWPGDAGMAVSVVLNIEEGAELSISDGDESNESVHEVTQPVHGAPDLCLASHFEYGTRAGYRRIADVAQAAGVPMTLNACARALIGVPWLARDAVQRGHEISAHGWRWEAHAGMDEDHERKQAEQVPVRRPQLRTPAEEPDDDHHQRSLDAVLERPGE